MKKQTGIWVNASMWAAYRELCSREKLRPAEPIEAFVEWVLKTGSALTALNMLQTMNAAEGFEAYTRVLLSWYKSGKHWIMVTDEDEAPIEPMLLEALKQVGDAELRREIEEALKIKTGKKPR